MDKISTLCLILDALSHPSPGARNKPEVKQKTANITKELGDIAKNAGISDAQIDLVTKILRFDALDSITVYHIDIKYGYGTSTIGSSKLGLYVDVLLNSEFANKDVIQELILAYKLPCKELLSKDFYYFFEAEDISVRFFDVEYYNDRSA